MTAAGEVRTVRPLLPVSLRHTLGVLRRGRPDPTMRFGPAGVWRATRTPAGPVTTHITTASGEGTVTMRAWGPGSVWALDTFPDLVGATDDEAGFEPGTGVVADLRRSLPGLRMCRTGTVTEALVPSIIEQKVVGIEAWRSYGRLVRGLGEPAPGPPGLMVPPSPAVLAATPSWAFHPFGIERRRADAIRTACAYAHRLEETCGFAAGDATRRLTALPGVGPWTAAEVALVALGDADAVSVGDYHLPDVVAWTLAGEARADDARMLELLAPWTGHRGRVLRLIAAGGTTPPRYGPRMPLRSIAGI